MWIVTIAWLYVAITMSLAEATNPQGTVLGALITLFFYGIGPLALVMYLLGTPARRKARREAEAAEHARQMAETAASQTAPDPSTETAASIQPDAGRLPSGDPVAPERKEP